MTDKTTKDLAFQAARILDDKKGEDIKVYDLQGKSSLCDMVIIATATSTPHLESLEQEVSTAFKAEGVYKSNRDGGDTGTWRVSDYGVFMLHLLTKTTREYYDLDKVFSFGKEADWQKPSAKKAVKKVAVKKVATKKVAVKKPAAKKTAVKSVKKVAVKKPVVKKTAVKATKKAAPKKAATKTTAKKPTVKKTVKKGIK